MRTDKEQKRRPDGRPHLSECLLVMAYDCDWADPEQYECTCDDWSPEWTLS